METLSNDTNNEAVAYAFHVASVTQKEKNSEGKKMMSLTLQISGVP